MLVLLIVVLVVYFLLTWSVVFHLKSYDLSPRVTRTILSVFLIVVLILFILNIIFYARIPWNNISQNIGNFFQNKFPQ